MNHATRGATKNRSETPFGALIWKLPALGVFGFGDADFSSIPSHLRPSPIRVKFVADGVESHQFMHIMVLLHKIDRFGSSLNLQDGAKK